jgi:hypothetical protein
VLFITSRLEDQDGFSWLQTTDGWIIEKKSQSIEKLLIPFKSNSNSVKSKPANNSIDINKLISKPIKINNKKFRTTSNKINEDNNSFINDYTNNEFEYSDLETDSDKLFHLQSQFQQISIQLNDMQKSVCSCQKVINEIILGINIIIFCLYYLYILYLTI